MQYNQLIKSITDYGITADKICMQQFGIEREAISENVVVAPWWEPSVLPDLGRAEWVGGSKDSAVSVWQIAGKTAAYTYIKTGIGAPVLMDVVLTLGLTKCKKILMIGSAGALEPSIKIGSVAVAKSSISGEGAGRYIASASLEDCFGEEIFPNAQFTQQLLECTEKHCQKYGVDFYTGRVFSVDTIFAQYAHMAQINNTGCHFIEMETAAAFRAAATAGIAIAAMLSISDNTMASKPIIGERPEAERAFRHRTRAAIFPQVIAEMFK